MSEATVPLGNIEYAYGFGVYESIRTVRGTTLFLPDHLERLMQSARILSLNHEFTVPDITMWTEELVQALQTDACNLKMLLIGAKEPANATLFILPLAPLFPDKRLYKKGASALTVSHERYLPHAKALNMLPSYLSYQKAKAVGCYDALFVNRTGCITEGTRTNFFALRGQTIVSPPEEEILQGVTLLHVLDTAKQNGFSVVHEPIPLENIGSYDGAFLTSTSSKIMPLSKIDDTTLVIPEALQGLMRHFDDFLHSIFHE